MTDETIRNGGCLCGAVRYETRGPVRGVVACHCSQCRKQTGHHYAATDVDDDKLTISGQDNLTWYRASDFALRGFCKTCGSALFWKMDESTRTSVLAGGFDEPSHLTLTTHIFCEDKGSYYDIDDGLPQHPASSQ